MPLARFYRLSPQRRRMLVKAAAALTAASAALAMLPFRRAIRFGSVPLQRASAVDPFDCVWAVEACARRMPWRTVCIEKGLAVQRMLRRGGVDAVLHYGARRSLKTGELEAHVWVSVSGEIVIGGEEALGMPELARFP